MTSAKPAQMVLALFLTTLAACGSGSADPQQAATGPATQPAPPANEKSALDAADVPATAVAGNPVGAWNLIAIDGAAVPEVGKQPTLVISEDGAASGVGGVNRYSAQIEISGGRVAFGPTAATKMAGPPEAMELESTFFTRLGEVSTFAVDGDTLRLWAGDNEALTFERAED